MKDHILVISQWGGQYRDYAGFEGHEYWRSESGQSWQDRQYHNDAHKYTPPTRGIKLYGQCNLNPQSELYGFNVSIADELSMNDIEQARADIARLTKIEKAYRALCDKFGYPKTFTQYAAYIAEVTGAQLAEYDDKWAKEYIPLSIDSLGYKESKLVHPDPKEA